MLEILGHEHKMENVFINPWQGQGFDCRVILILYSFKADSRTGNDTKCRKGDQRSDMSPHEIK